MSPQPLDGAVDPMRDNSAHTRRRCQWRQQQRHVAHTRRPAARRPVAPAPPTHIPVATDHTSPSATINRGESSTKKNCESHRGKRGGEVENRSQEKVTQCCEGAYRSDSSTVTVRNSLCLTFPYKVKERERVKRDFLSRSHFEASCPWYT
ncbi:hypothetical protein DQ04_12361030 [Trypanosoma grayi]|uniref:hypothetical protein n=1 Tax=Trypanosoma grayi TaxID=71804 RepID=UPI0004F4B339|nr:hypothetical protein DQ04_12361030 [Trypanosoma grayi]KEG06765.1 hypothetical protein DQ04_12361030 [Trypanosoma grayi]